jgi:hypothetical protein
MTRTQARAFDMILVRFDDLSLSVYESRKQVESVISKLNNSPAVRYLPPNKKEQENYKE